MSYQESLDAQIEKENLVTSLEHAREEIDCQIDAAKLDHSNSIAESQTKLEDFMLDIGSMAENVMTNEATQIVCLNFLTAVCEFNGVDMPDDVRISNLINAEEKAA